MPYRLHLFTGGQYRIQGVSRTACGFCRGGYQPPAVTPHRVCSGTQAHLILRKYRNRSLRRAAAITVRHRSRGFRAGRICQGIRRTPLGPGPQARHWHQIVSPEQRVTVGKEAQGSGREMAARPFRVNGLCADAAAFLPRNVASPQAEYPHATVFRYAPSGRSGTGPYGGSGNRRDGRMISAPTESPWPGTRRAHTVRPYESRETEPAEETSPNRRSGYSRRAGLGPAPTEGQKIMAAGG